MLQSLKALCARELAALQDDQLEVINGLPKSTKTVIRNLHDDLLIYAKTFARFWTINYTFIVVTNNLTVDWKLSSLKNLASVRIQVEWTSELLSHFQK